MKSKEDNKKKDEKKLDFKPNKGGKVNFWNLKWLKRR